MDLLHALMVLGIAVSTTNGLQKYSIEKHVEAKGYHISIRDVPFYKPVKIIYSSKTATEGFGWKPCAAEPINQDDENVIFPLARRAHLELIRSQMTFNQAEVYCETHGGHLASIHNRYENNEVNSLCQRVAHDCWIGLILTDENVFKWVDSSPVNFFNWYEGHEDATYTMGQCVKMLSLSHVGVWANHSCTANDTKAFAVCNVTGDVVTTLSTARTMPTQASNQSQVPGVTNPQGNLHKLSIDSDRKHFTMNGQRVFLSGINQAWVAYAYDFGNGQYQYRREVYEKVIREMQESGGNSIRVWIHIEGETSPQFDGNGFVTGLDRDGTFISDMRQYIRFAGQHGILVFPTLWNAAVKQNYHHHLDGLVKSTAKLQSYIDNALIPMVMALKDEPGLGGWDIINEPEGEIISGEMNTDPCFDSRFLQNSGAGWAGRMYTIQEYLRFINWQVDAIRSTDPQAQVTAGSWSPISVTDNFGHRNIYKDQCLIKAGGKQMGMLTFYSVHTYDWNGRYGLDAPFVNDASAYGLDKPIVIAEFNQKSGGGMKLPQQFDYAYNHGYAGAWSWSYTDEDWNAQKSGMSSIKNNRNPTGGGLVKLPM